MFGVGAVYLLVITEINQLMMKAERSTPGKPRSERHFRELKILLSLYVFLSDLYFSS